MRYIGWFLFFWHQLFFCICYFVVLTHLDLLVTKGAEIIMFQSYCLLAMGVGAYVIKNFPKAWEDEE